MDDHPVLGRCRFVADALDDAFRVPGTDRRVGLDPILGLLPAYGDAAALALSLYIVVEAWAAGVPKGVLLRMCLNVGVDALVGAVPLVGDLVDAGWKANRRNVELLEAHLE